MLTGVRAEPHVCVATSVYCDRGHEIRIDRRADHFRVDVVLRTKDCCDLEDRVESSVEILALDANRRDAVKP